MIVKRFELLPPKRMVPKTIALDHSATLPAPHKSTFHIDVVFIVSKRKLTSQGSILKCSCVVIRIGFKYE